MDLVAAAAATVAAGLAVHVGAAASDSEALQAVAGPVGDALYACLVYTVVAFIAVRARGRLVAATAFALCAAVELFQLTGVPAHLHALFAPSALLLGTTFSAWDLLAYAIGVAVALGLDTAGLRGRRRPFKEG